MKKKKQNLKKKSKEAAHLSNLLEHFKQQRLQFCARMEIHPVQEHTLML